MLDRIYTIPILLGIFLGFIMAGVQFSATALGSAIGDPGAVNLATVENNNDGDRVMRVLGKRFNIDVPFQGEAVLFDRAVPEKLVSAYSAACKTGRSYLEKISPIGGTVFEDLIKRCRDEIVEIMQGIVR